MLHYFPCTPHISHPAALPGSLTQPPAAVRSAEPAECIAETGSQLPVLQYSCLAAQGSFASLSAHTLTPRRSTSTARRSSEQSSYVLLHTHIHTGRLSHLVCITVSSRGVNYITPYGHADIDDSTPLLSSRCRASANYMYTVTNSCIQSLTTLPQSYHASLHVMPSTHGGVCLW